MNRISEGKITLFKDQNDIFIPGKDVGKYIHFWQKILHIFFFTSEKFPYSLGTYNYLFQPSTFVYYLGFMPQTLSLHDYMTSDEIFYFYGKIFGLCKSIIEEQKWNLLGILDLKSLRNRKIRNWSVVGIMLL